MEPTFWVRQNRSMVLNLKAQFICNIFCEWPLGMMLKLHLAADL